MPGASGGVRPARVLRWGLAALPTQRLPAGRAALRWGAGALLRRRLCHLRGAVPAAPGARYGGDGAGTSAWCGGLGLTSSCRRCQPCLQLLHGLSECESGRTWALRAAPQWLLRRLCPAVSAVPVFTVPILVVCAPDPRSPQGCWLREAAVPAWRCPWGPSRGLLPGNRAARGRGRERCSHGAARHSLRPREGEREGCGGVPGVFSVRTGPDAVSHRRCASSTSARTSRCWATSSAGASATGTG